MALYPGSLPAAGTANPNATLAAAGHTSLHNTVADEVRAVATKVGTGSSTPTSGTVLRGTGVGASAYGQAVLTTDVSGVLPTTNGGTGTTSITGTGANVFDTSPTLATPTLTTPVISNFSSATHDHTNAANGGTLGSLSVTGTQISTYRIIRQNDTTNTTELTARILTGWGWIAYDTGANTVLETVTFASAFTNLPIVQVTFGGDHGSSTTYGAGGNNISGRVHAKAHSITTSTFVVQLHNGEGVNFSAGNAFYQWQATGV